MSDLSLHLARSGGEPLDHFVEALRRAIADLGNDVVMDYRTSKAIDRELYALAMESPEDEVFV